MAGKAEISSHGTAGAAGARLNKKKINTFKSKPNSSYNFFSAKDIFELLQAQSIEIL